MVTPFSQLMNASREEPGLCELSISSDWMQGRSAFGGVQAAILLRAMRSLVAVDIPLRTLQVTFIAPVPQVTVQARAQVLRTGKSATHVEARLLDGEQVLAIATGVFGSARPSIIAVTPEQPRINGRGRDFPYIEGVTPGFTRHFAVRWLHGSFPYSGRSDSQAVLALDMHDSGGASEGHVLAIADFVPPLGLSWLDKPAPGSSLTWMLEFLGEGTDHLPLTGWRVDTELVAAAGGYTSQSSMVWGPGGEAVCLSRQSMVVFG